MDEVKETVFEHISGYDCVGVSTSERSWKTKILKLKAKFPDDVRIVAENADGSLYAKVPYKWVKISKPRHVSDKQREAAGERMRKMLAEKKEEGTKT